ncbi:hypothetical protein KO481_16445 [Nocardia sp. NEAU-G5]|uniref:DUF8176 domain-containing protein n=1 Tax=Nocardia albiluteola TaxID=2842303 RepID=A0ABS6AYI0_9NOCA|nr:hypothetical protein [Nocardia albiluteola]MBU3063111.1 hypothetical protein [Nocardia albiluteola]
MTETELWRRWLEDPVITRDPDTPVSVRRRRRRTKAGEPGRPRTAARRRPVKARRGSWFAVTAIAVVIGVVVLSVVRGGTRHDSATADLYPVVSTAAPTTTVAPFCAVGSVGGTVVTDGAGDRGSGPGVIAAYEHAYFDARDPKAALDLTDRGPGLPAEPQLAQGISSTPPQVPWCVSITDHGGGVYETAVRYLPAAGQPPVLWLLDITVTGQGGVFTIIRIQDKAA